MKDFMANIIDYRGGKALLLDSLDIIHLVSQHEANETMKIIEEKYSEVDYVLLITSMPLHMLRPKLRALIAQPTRSKSQVNCFRHITEKGKQTWRTYLEEQIKDQLDFIHLVNRRKNQNDGTQ